MTFAAPEDKKIACMRVAAEALLHLQRQAVHAAPHVGDPRRQPYPHPRPHRDHTRASTDSTRASAASSTPASTNTRYPFGVTTSIRLGAGALAARCSSTTTAGTKPLGAAATSVPARYALRQANSNEVEIPCRRAVADARRQPAKLSSTIRSFASLVQTAPPEFHHLEPLNLPTVLTPIHKDSPQRFARYRIAFFNSLLDG